MQGGERSRGITAPGFGKNKPPLALENDFHGVYRPGNTLDKGTLQKRNVVTSVKRKPNRDQTNRVCLFVVCLSVYPIHLLNLRISKKGRLYAGRRVQPALRSGDGSRWRGSANAGWTGQRRHRSFSHIQQLLLLFSFVLTFMLGYARLLLLLLLV